jgi:protein SCO1/2
MEKTILRVIVIAAVVGILAVAAWYVTEQAEQSRAELPVLGRLSPFEFVQHNGRPFNLDSLKGKVNVVDFIFTRCQGPCPIMTSTMAQLYERFAGTDKVRFVSISVDPDYDSVEVLARYAQRHGVTDNRWIFLHGPLEEVKRISEEDFMLDAQTLPAGHSTRFILVDEKAQIRGYYDSFDEASLTVLQTHLRELARKLP